MMQEIDHKHGSDISSEIVSDQQKVDSGESTTLPPQSSTKTQNESNIDISTAEPVQTNSGWNLTNWIKSASSNQFVQKVVEKTKTGVDKVITTLDPGMTPYIKSGGDKNIVVASDKEVKWGAVRDAFQAAFGAATVTGMAASSNVASQPVGYSAGLKGAQERIKFLRQSGNIDENQLCIAIESFIVEQIPDHWFDVACILLDDPSNNIKFEVFSLSVPVNSDIIADMQKSTPNDYDMRWSGLAVTVGESMQKHFSWIKPSDWHRALTGQSRREILQSACLLMAELYKRRLPKENLEQHV